MPPRASSDDPCSTQRRDTLARLAKRPGRPEKLRRFEEHLRAPWPAGEAAERGPVIGQFCNFVPDELVLAAGGLPLRLDTGCHARAQAGERTVGGDVCCAVRAAVGGGDSDPLLEACDLVVVPTACDGKKKLASLLGPADKIHLLQLPQTNRGDRALAWWHQEIGALVRRIERAAHRRIGRRALRTSIDLVNRRAGLVRRMNELRAGELPPIAGADALLVMQASSTAPVAGWVRWAEELVAELEQRAAAGEGTRPAARVLLTGSPVCFPDFKLPLLLEEAGADIVCDETCGATQRLYQPVVVDEWTRGSMIRAAAERVLLPCTCPCFSGGDGRADRLMELAASCRVDGVIHHTLRLCAPYDLDARAVAALFRGRDVPFLELHAEFGPEESEVLRGRVEAFVEMLAGFSSRNPPGGPAA